jgi:hypothetical protein
MSAHTERFTPTFSEIASGKCVFEIDAIAAEATIMAAP